jgi:hypothetical protein
VGDFVTLEKLKAICAGATPGPWRKSGSHVIQTAHVTRDVWRIASHINDADATHIATFNPSLVLAMLECLEAAQSMRASWIKSDTSPFTSMSDYDTKRAALEEMIGGLDVRT